MSATTRDATGSVSPFSLQWETIDAADVRDHPNLLAELLDETRDGVTISGTFTPEEIHRALTYLERLPPEQTMPRPFGWLLGMPIGGLDPSSQDRTPYLDDTARCVELYREAFGFSPHERIADILRPGAGPMDLIPASEDGRPYNAGQIRWWEPGHGGLVAHVGNEFRKHLEHGPMKHLLETTRVSNHLSYFVVLQKADQGGALSVYDLTFEQNPGRDSWADGMPDDSWIEEVPAVRLDLEPGQMVLFSGGRRWHRVDPPSGPTARVTYGGFAAPAIEGDHLHFWA